MLGISSKEREKRIFELLELLRLETEEGQPFPLENTPPIRALRGETVRDVVAIVHRVSDGKPIWVSISGASIRTPMGKPQGCVTTLTEVTAMGRPRGGNKAEGLDE